MEDHCFLIHRSRHKCGDERPLVPAIDLNGDAEAEWPLTSPDGRLRGNAGCPYVLLSPKTMRRIGEFFGHLAVLD